MHVVRVAQFQMAMAIAVGTPNHMDVGSPNESTPRSKDQLSIQKGSPRLEFNRIGANLEKDLAGT